MVRAGGGGVDCPSAVQHPSCFVCSHGKLDFSCSTLWVKRDLLALLYQAYAPQPAAASSLVMGRSRDASQDLGESCPGISENYNGITLIIAID